MNEEEVKKLLAEKEAELTDLFNKKLTEKDEALSNVVEEIKDLRQKKADIEAERDLLKAGKEKAPDDVDSKIDEKLKAERQKSLDKTKLSAKESFKEAHKELFQESNDPGGLKWAAFERKLQRINLEGLEVEKEFIDAYEDALIILKRESKVENGKIIYPFAATPPQNGNPPHEKETSNLDEYEKKLIESMGWDEERYMKMKKSRPRYVAQLLSASRGN